MKLRLIAFLCCLINLGCFTPVTDRLDALQAEIHQVNTQLAETNRQLERANQQLEKVEVGVRRMGGN